MIFWLAGFPHTASQLPDISVMPLALRVDKGPFLRGGLFSADSVHQLGRLTPDTDRLPDQECRNAFTWAAVCMMLNSEDFL